MKDTLAIDPKKFGVLHFRSAEHRHRDSSHTWLELARRCGKHLGLVERCQLRLVIESNRFQAMDEQLSRTRHFKALRWRIGL